MDTKTNVNIGLGESSHNSKVIILGAGIAGLSSGHFLNQRSDVEYQIYEASDRSGGLANSFKWHGMYCDFAPHRLYTEDKKVLTQLLDLVECDRLERKSKIVLRGKVINDPVNALELLLKFLPFKSIALASSYVLAKLKPKAPPRNFKEFVESRYGTGLGKLFFKPYAEKLFGIPEDQISEKWGERKVRVSGLKDMINKSSKLYFDHFYYPKQGGYGAFVNEFKTECEKNIILDRRLIRIEYNKETRQYSCLFENSEKQQFVSHCDYLISTIPITALAKALDFSMKLTYRPVKLVYLYVNKDQVMENHWMYFIDGDKKINRLAEFKNFTHKKIETGKTVICAEITNTLQFSVDEIISELVATGLVKKADILDKKVIDIPCAYPIYNLDYESQIENATRTLQLYDGLFYLGRQAQFEHQDIDEIYSSAQKTVDQLQQAIDRKNTVE